MKKGKSKDRKSAKHEPGIENYTLISNLRAAGDGNYHGLTATYLTILGILIGFDGLIVSSNESQTYISFFISFIGIFISLQMYAAQTRFRKQNQVLDRYLRSMEKRDKKLPKIKTLTDLSFKGIEIPKHRSMNKIKGEFILRNIRYFPRMKILPFVIISYFLTVITLKIIQLVN